VKAANAASATDATEAGSETTDGVTEAETTRTKAALGFLAFWAEHINRHFREEEEVLLPIFARYGDPWQPDIVQMLVEHVQIRRLAGDLSQQTQAGKPSIETMLTLGNLLHNHIRHEEDVLFPMMERTLPEKALIELPSHLACFEG